jgi:hypothetical protein
MRQLSVLLAVLAVPAFAQHDRAEQVRLAKVVVVAGSADHMDQVLRRANVPFVAVTTEELPGLPLHSGQVLMVNCRGEMSDAARERVRRFVAAGGFLYTTDHAVGELVQKLFPNTIAFTGTTSVEETFPMQLTTKDADRGLLKHLDSGSPRWQLAGGGYLFKVLDPHKVDVLMSSKEVEKRYGTGVLGARFRYEDGVVIHVTGHFFSQPGQAPNVAAAGKAFEQLSSNVLDAKVADQGRIDGMYKGRPRGEVMLQSAPAANAPPVAKGSVTRQSLSKESKVKMLEFSDDYVKVRDEQGNEGWAPKSAF